MSFEALALGLNRPMTLPNALPSNPVPSWSALEEVVSDMSAEVTLKLGTQKVEHFHSRLRPSTPHIFHTQVCFNR